MPEELGTRDVVQQLDTRLGNLEQGQRDLRAEVVTRSAQVEHVPVSGDRRQCLVAMEIDRESLRRTTWHYSLRQREGV